MARLGEKMGAEHVCSALIVQTSNLLRYGKCVIDVDAEVPDGTFDLGVTEEDLHGTQITGTSVNRGSRGPP